MPDSDPNTPPVSRQYEPELLSEYPSLVFENHLLTSPTSPTEEVRGSSSYYKRSRRLKNEEATIEDDNDSTVRLIDTELEELSPGGELIHCSCHLLSSVCTQLQTNVDKLNESHKKALKRIEQLEEIVEELRRR
ncbi:Schizosaccharomyces specific protein [Schizosaccharomyces osmophilus]|uniref:Schizosaccharomyces specific protein n=1 Tax=Schizosaccharomyces osmophilus TaxID=2545709 RepID=A0AAE9WA62_9SCHI|nr:Schizosaccharomyces specific protein [Schizosaccharomyces osmophilus]WBW71646.1 Schizosaccharomyces specific protein [Schizosaccharomyces osmophilus]